MKTHEGCKRQFVHGAEAYYASTSLGPDRVDYINIGMYHPDGGSTGEFMVTWIKLGDKVVPRLEVFDVAWSALYLFDDVLHRMSEVDGDSITPAAFCQILHECNVEDITPRRDPALPTRKSNEAEDLLKLCLSAMDNQSLFHDIQKFLNH